MPRPWGVVPQGLQPGSRVACDGRSGFSFGLSTGGMGAAEISAKGTRAGAVLVSPPHGSPAELLRATHPHALTPSHAINRYVGVQPPGKKRNESIRETSRKPGGEGQAIRRDLAVSLRSRDSGHLHSSSVHASAPQVGADRVNLIVSPSFNNKRESEKTTD
jgi:hypothetical protein